MVHQGSPVLAPKIHDLFFDRANNWIPSRFKVMHGGRGGLKTWGFARVANLLAAKGTFRFLCIRAVQNSIRESVHHTLASQIELLGLSRYFDVKEREIRCTLTGSEFIFVGINNNPDKIKSFEGFQICWVEEAANITERAWRVLTPTVLRTPNAEIWAGFNPDLETDAT